MASLPFDNRDGVIWMDGKFVPWREANLHVLSHGLHYGSSVFEGIRAYPSVKAVEEEIDMAVFAIPAALLPATLEAVGAVADSRRRCNASRAGPGAVRLASSAVGRVSVERASRRFRSPPRKAWGLRW